MAGTTIAQLIPIAISPILTRIYAPEDFGIFALYSAMVLMIGGISSANYELAINLPRLDVDARHLVGLSIFISFFVSVVILILVILFNGQITMVLNNPDIGFWLYLVPLGVFLSGIYMSLTYWLNRCKQFRTQASARVLQASMAIITQTGVGIASPGPVGLVTGSLFGQLSAIFVFVITARKDFLKLKNGSFRKIKSLAIRYKKFPIVQAPSSLAGSSSSELPVLLLGSLFNPAIVGFFALSQRVVRIPVVFIGTSIGEVFRQKASEDYSNRGDSSEIFLSTFKKLALISTPFGLIFALFAPVLFGFVFGDDWRVAGEFAQILTPFFWLSFIVNPLSVMIIIAERQEISLMIQLTQIVATMAALAAGYYVFDSAKYAIGGYTLVYCLKYLVELYFAFRFCKNPNFVNLP